MKSTLLSANRWLNRHEVLLFLLLFVIVLRLPTLYEPFWYGDENIYLAIGQAMRSGRILYQGITDFPNKPPAIYFLAALVKNVTNFRFVLLVWSLIHTTIIFRLSKIITGKTLYAFNFTLLFVYLSSTPIYEGTIANAEIFFILPVTAALLALLTRPKKTLHITTNPKRHFLAGLLLGIAFLFKIHVALDIAAFGLFFYLFPHPSRVSSIKKILSQPKMWLFVAGILTPILTSLILLGIFGISPLFLFQNAASSGGYVSFWQQQDWFTQFITFGSLYSRLLALLLITLTLYFLRHQIKPLALFFPLWTLFALFAALLSARPYPHYLIQLFPPIVLGLAYLSTYTKRKHILLYGVTAIILLAAYIRFDFGTYPVVPYYQNFTRFITGQIDRTEYYRRFDSRMPRNYLLANYINHNTSSKDQIYIWGTEPEVYVLSNRNPVGELVVSFHVPDLNYYQPTIQAIEASQPPLIIWMESEHRDFPQLQALLAHQYSLVAKIGDPDKTPNQNKGNQALVFRRLK